MKIREFIKQIQPVKGGIEDIKSKTPESNILYLDDNFKFGSEPNTNQLTLNDKPFFLPEGGTIIITAYSHGSYSDKFLNEIMKAGIRMFKLDYYGNPVWEVNPKTRANAFLMKSQILFNEPQFYELKKQLIEQLINEKLKSEGYPDEITLKPLKKTTTIKKWLSDAMLLEGKKAAEYWEWYRGKLTLDEYMTRRGVKGVRGKRKDNRNATDAVNALLNLGYGILAHNITYELYQHGLEPTLGFYHDYAFHESRNPRYSLTWDIIEPYRTIIDKYVLKNIDDIDLDGFTWDIKQEKRFIMLDEQPHKVGRASQSEYKKWVNRLVKEINIQTKGEYPFIYEYKKYLQSVLEQTGITDKDALRRIVGRLAPLGTKKKEIIKPEPNKPILEPINKPLEMI